MEAVRSGIFTRLTVANNELHLDSSSHRDNIFHTVERSDVWAKDQRKSLSSSGRFRLHSQCWRPNALSCPGPRRPSLTSAGLRVTSLFQPREMEVDSALAGIPQRLREEGVTAVLTGIHLSRSCLLSKGSWRGRAPLAARRLFDLQSPGLDICRLALKYSGVNPTQI